MLRSLANWWDSVELWITQLPFPFQVALAIVVLLPLCALVAALADKASDAWDAWWERLRGPRHGSGGGSDAVAGDPS
ncbi:hypothetical protein [Pseudonocardia acaciae]|uniref:hypothetical protein n=1 Tax=Pseudonocardia acaciae TaxID=551276 RepID=UPI00055D2ADC|nr:hypothetical protein [Pseudonocardia acaciae]